MPDVSRTLYSRPGTKPLQHALTVITPSLKLVIGQLPGSKNDGLSSRTAPLPARPPFQGEQSEDMRDGGGGDSHDASLIKVFKGHYSISVLQLPP